MITCRTTIRAAGFPIPCSYYYVATTALCNSESARRALNLELCANHPVHGPHTKIPSLLACMQLASIMKVAIPVSILS